MVALGDAISALWRHPLPSMTYDLSVSSLLLACIFAGLFISAASLVRLFRHSGTRIEPEIVVAPLAIGATAGVAALSLGLSAWSMPTALLVVSSFISVSVTLLAVFGLRLAKLHRGEPARRLLFTITSVMAAIATAGFLRRQSTSEGIVNKALIEGSLVVVCVAITILFLRRRSRAIGAAFALANVMVLSVAGIGIHSLAVRSTYSGGSAGSPPQPNVLLITIDTLRADHGPCTWADLGGLPNLEALCGMSSHFTRAYSAAPWTLPSMASIMTGTSPVTHGVIGWESGLPDELQTLAEKLLRGGYSTAAVTTNIYLERKRGFARGFERFEHLPISRMDYSVALRIADRLSGNLLRATTVSPDISGLSVRFLSQSAKDKPLFLWAHYLDPHAPYEPASLPFDGNRLPGYILSRILSDPRRQAISSAPKFSLAEKKWVERLYGRETTEEYGWVEELLNAWRRSGRWEDSVIVLTSDHGEEFWEHGHILHGYDLYDPLLHVPLIVKTPGQVAARTRPAPISTVAIHQYLLAEASGSTKELGSGETPLPILSTSILPPPIGSDEAQSTLIALHKDAFKLIWDPSGEAPPELYNVQQDPAEARNLAQSQSGILNSMMTQLKLAIHLQEQIGEQLKIQPKTIGPLRKDETKALHALGYL